MLSSQNHTDYNASLKTLTDWNLKVLWFVTLKLPMLIILSFTGDLNRTVVE